jgi:cyclopropane-fatty-acyl-phospholipid synthase
MAERSRGDRPVVVEAAHAAPDPATVAAVRRVLAPVFDGYDGPVAVRMANGALVAGRGDAACTLILRHPAPLRDLVLRWDVLRLAEAHLAGEIDIAGDVTALFDLLDHVAARPPRPRARLGALGAALRLPRRRAAGAAARRAEDRVRRNSQKTIAHHYDVGNAFYRLWLDPEMVYSGAYFKDPGQSLADAQADKLDYLCRKLRLAPGLTLLDIGCGWGALACRAARDFGARVHAITLSEAQHAHAAARVAAEGLGARVTVELRDYRALPVDARYDRVVSVGMFEHVGTANFPTYFETVRRVLKDGGLFLNQAISSDQGWRRTPLTRFLNRYVFPDGELVRISDALGPMERAGFEVLDVEALRRHYALTLRRWLASLEGHRRRAVDLVGEATWRVWRLYMAGAVHYFEEGSINLYQVLAAPARRPLAVPLRREDLYHEVRPAGAARAGS